MSSFYSNLVKEDIKNTEKRVKNVIVLKKSPKKPNFKKTVIAGG
jgi:hypothetical protein